PAARTGRRPVYFDTLDTGGRFVETPVYDRARLGGGVTLRGPAVLEERESTLIVPPGARVHIERTGHAIVTLAARRGRAPRA
ncbi:MAG: hydantoinase/oxoprolinase family protein, partial [Candidatus Rokuibacteriota bacterium]